MESSSSVRGGAPSTPATEAGTPLPPQPPPSPRSPPTYPDVCGRHRLQVDVQILNREIGFLEEELQSLDDLQPASSCCKGVNEFVATNPDPFLHINPRRHRCSFWRWLGMKLSIGISWISCCGCSCKMNSSDCCTCKLPKNCCYCSYGTPKDSRCCSREDPKHNNCSSCIPSKMCGCCYCAKAKCGSCMSCCARQCCCQDISSCCRLCCSRPSCGWPEYYCGCVCSCSNCAGARVCPRCCKPCCISRCLCP